MKPDKLTIESINYDRYGRLHFNPLYHFSQGSCFTESDLEYICKYYDYDGAKSISLAVGKTEYSIQSKVHKLRKNGLYSYYKNLNKHW
ncbi:DNA-entry nuclease [Lysinibacillus xylanilyticus]|uniref:DNA-entry nuclease n=1 Tax=Lysinibacillus xylanilyticus TaxID=582475 RepID=A0ABT4ESQ4_9BACI|nr:DNA-entry nuclease [Lysinibacillus xylanilyticus]MCY9547306.1 DNA-entry nuclease [Lysinibacillus xylanilyticus]